VTKAEGGAERNAEGGPNGKDESRAEGGGPNSSSLKAEGGGPLDAEGLTLGRRERG
jgi:hypothetical protein